MLREAENETWLDHYQSRAYGARHSRITAILARLRVR